MRRGARPIRLLDLWRTNIRLRLRRFDPICLSQRQLLPIASTGTGAAPIDPKAIPILEGAPPLAASLGFVPTLNRLSVRHAALSTGPAFNPSDEIWAARMAGNPNPRNDPRAPIPESGGKSSHCDG
jgi:hypothetical protein